MRRANGGGAVRQRDVELTERQRQVLRLIAAGKTNAEIGEALGISLDGAKWHVSEILAKLDVSTREEAGELWRGREGVLAKARRAVRAMVPMGWLKIAGAVAGLAAMSATVVVVLVVLREIGGGQRLQTVGVTPTVTAAPSATATPNETVGAVPTPVANLPAWSQQLPTVVQQVARAVTVGDRAAIIKLLHFRSPFGKPYIGFLTNCQGGGGLDSADDVAQHLLEISARRGVLSEAAKTNEEVQTPNLVYFLIFTLADPAETRAVVVDDQGVILLYQGCDPTANSFAGDGNGTIWR
jgi:DNA-binding CsgD family transcriptional regulator